MNDIRGNGWLLKFYMLFSTPSDSDYELYLNVENFFVKVSIDDLITEEERSSFDRQFIYHVKKVEALLFLED